MGEYFCWLSDPYWFTCGWLKRFVLRWPSLQVSPVAWRFEAYLGFAWVRFGKLPPVAA